jgi:Flp pilus assembly protein TadG
MTRRQHFVPNEMQKDSRGQSLVETALMLPFLMLILTGVIDLGRVYYTYVTITNGAREGARFGANDPNDTTGIKNRAVQEAASSTLNPALATSNVTVDCSAVSPESYSSSYCLNNTNPHVSNGEKVRVTISYGFQFITTYIFGFGQLTISNNAVMAVSR